MGFGSKLGFLIVAILGLQSFSFANNGGQEGHGGNHIVANFRILLDRSFDAGRSQSRKTKNLTESAHCLTSWNYENDLESVFQIVTNNDLPKVFEVGLDAKSKPVLRINSNGWLNLRSDTKEMIAGYVGGLLNYYCANRKLSCDWESMLMISDCIEDRLHALLEEDYENLDESSIERDDFAEENTTKEYRTIAF